MAVKEKVEVRDVVYEMLAQLIVEREDFDSIARYKEGLRLEMEGETFIVKVIKKKSEPDKADKRGDYVVKDGVFLYESLEVAKD